MQRSLGAGLRAAVTQPWLALLLWTWSAMLSLAAALPGAVWLSRGLSLRPRGDVLLDGFSFEVLKELLHYDASPVATVLGWAALGPMALAAVTSAMINGGLLEVLWARGGSDDARPRLHRFFRGAGRFLLVNFRLLLISSVAASLLIVLLLAALGPISAVLDGTQVEALAWIDLLLPLALVVLVVIAWGTVLDFARLRVVATDDRRAVAALRWAVPFVARHPLSSLGIWAVPAAITLALAAAGVSLVPYVPVAGWAGILALLLAQQALVFGRAMLRVATVAAEASYARPRRVGDAAAGAAIPESQPALPFLGEGL